MMYIFVANILVFLSSSISVISLYLWLKESYNYYTDHGEYENINAKDSTHPIACVIRVSVIFVLLLILSYIWMLTLLGVIFWSASQYGYVQKQKHKRFMDILKGPNND